MIVDSIDEYNSDMDTYIQSLENTIVLLKVQNHSLDFELQLEKYKATIPPSYNHTPSTDIQVPIQSLQHSNPIIPQSTPITIQSPTTQIIQDSIQPTNIIPTPIQSSSIIPVSIQSTVQSTLKKKVNRGVFVQKINKNTFEIVCVYNSIIDAVRNNPHLTTTLLKTSVAKQFIYLGYRWFFVDRNDDPNIQYDILPSVVNDNTKRYCNIIQIKDDTLVNVYSTQQSAAKINGITKTTMYSYINSGKLLKGYQWYLETNLPPHLEHLKTQISIKIQDNKSNENDAMYYKMDGDIVVSIYATKDEIIKTDKTSYRVLNRVLNTSECIRGYTYVYK
jgi:hypothetical protein